MNPKLVPISGTRYIPPMQVIAKRTLREFWQKHPKAETPLKVWHSIASRALWENSQDIRRQFGNTVDFVADNRVMFDIGGSKCRPIVHVSYTFKRVLIKFIGTHKEYDMIDPETV